MKTLEELRRKLPYVMRVAGDTYATKITVAGQEGSAVFGQEGVWEHVSFAPFSQKLPTWTAMCELKDLFWNNDECVIQMHPKKSEYVNIKENCLHLWRMKEIEDIIERNR